MKHLFRPNPATKSQLARMRELAQWPGMPPEAAEYTEARIAKGLTVDEAFVLLRQLGKRVREVRDA